MRGIELAWALLLALTAVLATAVEITPLNRLDHGAQSQRITSDGRAVLIYRIGLHRALDFGKAHPELFPTTGLEKARTLPRSDKELIWSTWRTFLDYFIALDAIADYHRGWMSLPEGSREGSRAVFHATQVTRYRSALDFIALTSNNKALDVILDEPVPELGLPAGAFSSLRMRFLNPARASEFTAIEFLDPIDKIPNKELQTAISEDSKVIWQAGKGPGLRMTAENAIKVVKGVSFTATFPIQAGIACWMGDTKVWRKERSLISKEQAQALVKHLEPGDILLERREWYLSNVGLPGWWPHAALYVGTREERAVYFADAATTTWVKAQGRGDGDFNALLADREPNAVVSSGGAMESSPLRILEAMSEGVVFTSVEHSAAADSVAVLRPRLPRSEKAAAILRAFHYAGRPYDFDFDFLTDSSLVCTELVYKAYEANSHQRGIAFPLEEVAGRTTLPANRITRLFDEQYGTKEQQLDFVTFLDGDEKQGKAMESDLAAFRKSWRRPKWHIITSSGK